MLDMLNIKPNLRPLKKDVVGDVGRPGVTMGALGLVLLLVCANVANLVLVRAQSRNGELAIRRARRGLGKNRAGAIGRERDLGIVGGVLGLILAYDLPQREEAPNHQS